MRIGDFIEQSGNASSLNELLGHYLKALSHYGYSNSLDLSQDGHDPDSIPRQEFKLRNVDEYLAEYNKRNYGPIDPLFKVLPHARGPFLRDELLALPLTAVQKQLMHLRYDMLKGTIMIFPLRSGLRNIIATSIGSKIADARTDKNAMAEMFAVVNQYHLCRSILLNDLPLALPPAILSPREKELLQWCAQGKSNGVIGSIVNISEKTVEFHLRSAFRKLDASCRTTAVLKAVNLHLIAL